MTKKEHTINDKVWLGQGNIVVESGGLQEFAANGKSLYWPVSCLW